MTGRVVLTFLAVAFLACLFVQPAQAVNPDEILADPQLEQRARALSKDLRCVVCRNQSIDDSNAGIARDMRIVLRERLVAGDSDSEAMQYLVDRYGEFILLKPPFKPVTFALWATPVLMVILTVWGFSRIWRRRGQQDVPVEPPISAEDRATLSRLLQTAEEEK